MHIHAQNLCQRAGWRSQLSFRAWLHVGPYTGRVQISLGFQGWHGSVGVDQDIERGRGVHLCTPLTWFSLGCSGPRSHLRAHRSLSLSVHDGMFWWHLWTDPSGWDSERSRWREGGFGPADFLFGPAAYSEETRRESDVALALPEATYLAHVRLYVGVWKRPRWPWARRVPRYEITLIGKVPPVPGKGESAWNCGDDGIASLSAPGTTFSEAVEHYVEHVIRLRLRRGAPVDYNPKVPSPT